MNAPERIDFIRQHLIDPEVCIRCNTCEETCPVDAITHDSRNYVVDPAVCNGCNACISPCPTGSIDHWHWVPKARAHSVAEQLGWDELPVPQEPPADAAVTEDGAVDVAAKNSLASLQFAGWDQLIWGGNDSDTFYETDTGPTQGSAGFYPVGSGTSLSSRDRTSSTKLPRSRPRTLDMTTMRRWPSSRSTNSRPRVTSICAT